MLSFRCTVCYAQKNEVKIAFRPPAPFLLVQAFFLVHQKVSTCDRRASKQDKVLLFQRRIGCQMQSRSMMSSAKPTNATLFGSCRDVSALKKVPSPSATKKAQRQHFLQPIDAAAGKEFRAWDDAKNSKKRTDLKKIMIIGAGPIVIGQVIRIYLHRIHILRSLPRSS